MAEVRSSLDSTSIFWNEFQWFDGQLLGHLSLLFEYGQESIVCNLETDSWFNMTY